MVHLSIECVNKYPTLQSSKNLVFVSNIVNSITQAKAQGGQHVILSCSYVVLANTIKNILENSILLLAITRLLCMKILVLLQPSQRHLGHMNGHVAHSALQIFRAGYANRSTW